MRGGPRRLLICLLLAAMMVCNAAQADGTAAGWFSDYDYAGEAQAYSDRADQDLKAGDAYQALRDIRIALALDPSNQAARDACVAVLSVAGRTDYAEVWAEHGCQDLSEPQGAGSDVTDGTAAMAYDPQVLALIEQSARAAGRADYVAAASAYAEAARRDARVMSCLDRGTDQEEALILRAYDMALRPDAYASDSVLRSMADLEAALARNRYDPIALRERALLLAAVGDWRSAARNLNLAAGSDPQPRDAMVLLARSLLVRFRYVLRWLQGAPYDPRASAHPTLTPDDSARLVRLYVRLPLDLVRQAKSMGASGPIVDLTLGQALMNAGYQDDADPSTTKGGPSPRFADAIAAFTDAIAELPDIDSTSRTMLTVALMAYDGLATAYFKVGDNDRSMQASLAQGPIRSAFAGPGDCP